jgi:predicted transcriptional regulator
VLLKNRAFDKLTRVRLTLNDFAPNKDSIALHLDDLALQGIEYLAQYTINLRPYMNKSHETINPNQPLTAVYRKFRSLQLRHLIVTSSQNHVAGIITRKEVMTDFRSDLS